MGKWLVVIISLCLFILSACSSVPRYEAPSDKAVSETLDGGEWISDMPAPPFITDMDNRYYDTMDEVAIIEFYEVSRDEVASYVNELDKKNYKITNVIEYFSGNEESAQKQKRAKYYDGYIAEKGSMRLEIDMKAYNDNVVQFKMDGLSKNELSALNIQEDSLKSGVNYETVEKYIRVEASKEINERQQTKNVEIPDYWYFDMPAPAYGHKESEHYSTNVGKTMVFESVTSKEFNAYLATLEDDGYDIEKAVSYYFNVGVEKNSYHYAENRNNLDRAKREMKESINYCILASKDEVIIRFNLFLNTEDIFIADHDRLVIVVIGLEERMDW